MFDEQRQERRVRYDALAMKVVVTGANGMLGRTLLAHVGERHEVIPLSRAELELRDGSAVRRTLVDRQPDVVLHAAAYTRVDAAETDVESAYADNVLATAHVADATRRVGARLVTFSTDYVFAGDAGRPYRESDPVAPRTVYGETKWAAENAARHHCPDHLILRIAWLYGLGGPSFVHAIVTRARSGQPLKVVDDQVGNPTSCRAVAELVLDLLETSAVGTLHATCEGETSWYGFARAFLNRLGLAADVTPCSTAEFPRPAPRPANSRLENLALRGLGLRPMPQWDAALDRFLEEAEELKA